MQKQGLEIWGGLECTINRVGNDYFNQLDYSGHHHRETDHIRFAELGIQKIRYPILWESHQPSLHQNISWQKTAAQLGQLRSLGIEPIAGLLHHGSGPLFTHLLHPEFACQFANYAALVARRFPWLNYYTPINEPLTTARFSGLYGLWYPHSRDDLSFLRILINECKASMMAMQSIRKINASAQWIQTEDLGKTHSTALLSYQADFENYRRWLGFDLMAGRVNAQHPLWDYLLWAGIKPAELHYFEEHPLQPDLIGFNYYVTSERYLDENLAAYPTPCRGSNKMHHYADVEAVRACPSGLSGIKNLIREAWLHLQKPMAITEVHLHCSRDEQLRWFYEIWQNARQIVEEGIPLQAITAWALLGSYGWDSLLTQSKGSYESGVFDMSSGQPRATALCKLIKHLAQGKAYHHPVIEQAGWWHKTSTVENIKPRSSLKPIIIIGKSGTLGQAFARVCEHRAIDYQLLGRPELDISNTKSIENMIHTYRPWAIINTAGYVRVDEAEKDFSSCFISNTIGAENLAKVCHRHGIPLLSYSSDMVFDGKQNIPYRENDPTSPLNIYGHSKALAERRVLKANPNALMIRTSAFFGPWDQVNFAQQVLQRLQNRQEVFAASDMTISPSYVPELVNRSLDLLIDEEKGIWHLSNETAISWADFALAIAQKSGYGKRRIIAVTSGELGFKAQRPRYSVLSSNRGAGLGSLDGALHDFLNRVA